MIKTTQIAENGPTLSRIVAGVMKWGAWGKQLDTRQIQQLMEQCVELGVTSFDHADIYGHYSTELEFGVALRLTGFARKHSAHSRRMV